MKNRRCRWILCIACTLLMCCTIGLIVTVFTTYLPYMIKAGSLTKAQGSFIPTVRSLVSLAAMLLVKAFYKRWGVLTGVITALLAGVGSFVLYGCAQGLVGYCCAAGLSGVAYGFGGMIPVSILIDRYFRAHKTLVLSICMSGSGFSAIVFPPVFTLIAEKVSLAASFFTIAAFFLLVVLFWVILVRKTMGEERVTPDAPEGESVPERVDAVPAGGQSRGMMICLLAGAAGIGISAYGANLNMSGLYIGQGFLPLTVSFMISALGVVQTAAKFLYGHAIDVVGTRRANRVFFPLTVCGVLLCCFAYVGSVPLALVSLFCFGAGLPVATVGISVFARDMSTAETYAGTLQKTQLCYSLGALAAGPITGYLADWQGSYIPAYQVLTAVYLAAFLSIQGAYKLRSHQRLPKKTRR